MSERQRRRLQALLKRSPLPTDLVKLVGLFSEPRWLTRWVQNNTDAARPFYIQKGRLLASGAVKWNKSYKETEFRLGDWPIGPLLLFKHRHQRDQRIGIAPRYGHPGHYRLRKIIYRLAFADDRPFDREHY